MLVLTRKPQTSVTVGRNAELVVKVISIEGNQVKLGFQAPKEIAIYREEIFQQMQNNNQKHVRK